MLRVMLFRLEARLQALVEGGVARLFSERMTPHDLAFRLEEAMRSGVYYDAEARAVAPNLFTLRVHPEHCQRLQANQALLNDLTDAVRAASQEAGFYFDSPVIVRVSPASELEYGEIQVLAQNSSENLPTTVSVEVAHSNGKMTLPENAFLIVDGTHIFPLVQPVINIGRGPENQLVVNDRHVSRLHAQLRVVAGRFVIFDLGSSGGTWVNGERVQQYTLRPGDVITLSVVPLVFGQDAARQENTRDLLAGSGGNKAE